MLDSAARLHAQVFVGGDAKPGVMCTPWVDISEDASRVFFSFPFYLAGLRRNNAGGLWRWRFVALCIDVDCGN